LCLNVFSSLAADLLDEISHFILRKGAIGVIIIVLKESIEIILGDLRILAELCEEFLNKVTGLSLAKSTAAILVKLSPDLVNNLRNSWCSFNRGFFFFRRKGFLASGLFDK
jgi:hypothetical protein